MFAFSPLPFDSSSLQIVEIAMVIVLLVVSLGIHEAAHGWVALKCGDTTARDLGRITLNPGPHIDPFMTIVLPAILYLSGAPIFGGAKPVPVNFHNLRRPYRDMAFVALAGPISNFLLAIFFFAVQHLVVDVLQLWAPRSLGDAVLGYAVGFNILLAAFNMIPIPPLDGSRVMTYLLPAGSLRENYANLERFGLFLVIAFVFFIPGGRTFLFSAMGVIYQAVSWLATFGGTW